MAIDLHTTTATTKDLYEAPAHRDTITDVKDSNPQQAQSRAVEYMDGRLVFDPEVMEPGRPYLFHFLEHWMAVRKAENSDLEFFYFSNESAEE